MLVLSIETRTWAHNVPVGLKMLVLLIASFVLFSITNIFFLIPFLFISILLYLSLGWVVCVIGLKSLRPIVWVLGIILIFHFLRTEMLQGSIIVIRIAILALLANFVTMTSRLTDTIDMVLWVLSPLKILGVRIASIGLVFALVMRFTPVLIQRASSLSMAWRARAKSTRNWRIIMPLFISVIDDAENISEALRARGGTR